MPVSSQPSEGHLMTEEVGGSWGIPPRHIRRTLMEVWCFLWLAVTPFLWIKLFFVLGAPPPYPGQWENPGLHFLPKWLGYRHRQACVWELAWRYVFRGFSSQYFSCAFVSVDTFHWCYYFSLQRIYCECLHIIANNIVYHIGLLIISWLIFPFPLL